MLNKLFGIGGKKAPKGSSYVNYNGIDVPVSKNTLTGLGKLSGANVTRMGMDYVVDIEQHRLKFDCLSDAAIAKQVSDAASIENAIAVARHFGKKADWFANVTEGKYVVNGRTATKAEIKEAVERYFK